MNQEILKNKISIILVEPQLGENIGTTARAMLNFGFENLILINPRDDWPNDYAIKAAAGANKVINNAIIFKTLEDSLKDFSYAFSTTIRPRDMVKPVFGLEKMSAKVEEKVNNNDKVALVFGREKSGLTNHQISLTDAIIEIPTNKMFSSLNLAQAVILVVSEINRLTISYSKKDLPIPDSYPVKKGDLISFFNHLERALDEAGFLKPLEKKPTMMMNIRNMFNRANLTDQEVKTLRGIITALLRWPNDFKNIDLIKRIKKIANGNDKNKHDKED
ncbi:RNA methyltransferase [Hyphomicrobiales bacterium]|nr:RNA methyltransferase [Hyphomicrobiales bacterium]